MDNFQKIINSFSVRKELNSKIWEDTSKTPKMNPKVRKGLLKISEEFINYLGDDVFVDDIVLTGSLSNYNWSEYSDFDLHILIDFDQYGKQFEIYKDLFNLKKQIFNEKHNIKIFGYDVELYAQDVNETHYASGVYSIMNDEWVTEPKKMKFNLDKDLLKNKVKCWTEKIESVVESGNQKNIETLKDKIKKYRKSGLEKEGELSYENLVFKFLRRSEHMRKLMDASNKVVDKKLSIERKLEESSFMSDELLGGDYFKIPDDGAHKGQSGWQSANAWDIKASIGTPVYSLTNGVLRTFSDYGNKVIKKQNKKLFGQSFTVESDEGQPNVYYTHLKNSTVQRGSRVECGQLLGYIMDFPKSSYDHVHIGVEPPGHIKDLITSDGKIICSPDTKTNLSSGEGNYERTIQDSDFVSKIGKLVKGTESFRTSTKYDPKVELLQSALVSLGYPLPKWGVDGKFGPETKRAVAEFQKDSGLTPTGSIEKDELWYLFAALMFKDL